MAIHAQIIVSRPHRQAHSHLQPICWLLAAVITSQGTAAAAFVQQQAHLQPALGLLQLPLARNAVLLAGLHVASGNKQSSLSITLQAMSPLTGPTHDISGGDMAKIKEALDKPPLASLGARLLQAVQRRQSEQPLEHKDRTYLQRHLEPGVSQVVAHVVWVVVDILHHPHEVWLLQEAAGLRVDCQLGQHLGPKEPMAPLLARLICLCSLQVRLEARIVWVMLQACIAQYCRACRVWASPWPRKVLSCSPVPGNMSSPG